MLVGTAGWMADAYERRTNVSGLWLGLLGVAIFALTLPMTRLAVGTPEAPQMSGVFIALGRAAVAARAVRRCSCWPRARPGRAARDWWPLAVTAAGVVFGFPLFTSIAMRHVEAVHASVIVGVLPLATAAGRRLLHRQRPVAGFWLCAALGSALVVGFAVLRSGAAACAARRPTCCCWPPWPAPPSATATARACRSACAPST